MAENSSSNYYTLLGVAPSASVQQIRRAYRELSKLYHPDTTALPEAIATTKFQQLNDAYATLSSPDRRASYDLKMGYSRISVMQAPADLNRPVSESRKFRSSAYLEPHDRPLSAGELFALFILGVTFIACLVLVVTISLTRGEQAFQPLTASQHTAPVEADVAFPDAPASETIPGAIPLSPEPIPDAEVKTNAEPTLRSPEVNEPTEVPFLTGEPSVRFTIPTAPIESTPPIRWNSSPPLAAPQIEPPVGLPSPDAESSVTDLPLSNPTESAPPIQWNSTPPLEPSLSNPS